MRAVVIPEKGTVEIASLPDPAPGEGEVVVEVAGCGICGTDLHILQGEFAPSLPLVPGHEFAGEVVAVGPGVEGLVVGEAVAVDPTLNCGRCRQCRLGRFNLCERWRAIGVSDPGGAAQFAVAPAANCVKLPERVSTRDAALIEPLSCAVRGYDVLRMRLADHVLIYGSGTVIDPYRIYNEEITITGSMAVNQSYERAAELFLDGVVDPAVFISDRLPLEDYEEAIDRMRRGVGRKIQVLP